MIRVAIVGAGAISDSHIQSYLKFNDRSKIVAFVDLFPDKAAEKVKKYNLDVKIYKTVDELIQQEAFEAASVCLPPFEHEPASVKLLNAGKHVLVEKPMATSLEECDRMISAAEKNEKLLSVVAQNRFRTAVMRLKKILETGVAGKILHGQADSFWWRGSNYYDLWWRGTYEKEGGGCTINHAVHHIDLFLWLMGMPESVLAVTANLAHTNSEVEDFSTAVLFYNNNSIGQINASLVHHGEEQRLVFQCEKAGIYLPWKIVSFKQMENGFPTEDTDFARQLQAMYDSLPEARHTGHDGQIDNFLSAIEGKQPLLVDGYQGRNTIMVITAIYLSAHLGEPVQLPLNKDSIFYTREGILKNAKRFYQKTRSVDNFSQSSITFGKSL